MDEFYGKMTAPIWLIGDSAPKRDFLVRWPLDRRHPAVHNIWTPILYGIQKNIYTAASKIITNEDDVFFIKNAALTAPDRPKSNIKSWENNTAIMNRLESTKKDIAKHSPKMVITFGAFAYEFMRRCYIDKNEWHKATHWGAATMGAEFRKSIHENGIIIPLLHVSISQGKWRQSHDQYTGIEGGNYFEYVAEHLYKRIIAVLGI